MFTLTVENEKGERLNLTHNPNYTITDVGGLTPPTATINSATVALNDGAIYNSARVETRDVSISIKPMFPVESNRINLYRYFSIKKRVRLHYTNGARNVYIDGYVQGVDGSLFELSQTIVITLLCLDPYFKDVSGTAVDMSSTEDLFEFPFAIDSAGIEFSRIEKPVKKNIINSGEIDNGMIIEMTASGTVVNPKIYNTLTSEMLGLSATLQAGDVVRINTNQNQKNITLIRDGVESNAVNMFAKESVWLQLAPGDNVMTYECDSGEEFLEVRFSYTNRYGGV